MNLIKSMERVSKQMALLSERMRKIDDTETKRHADELLGASKILIGWSAHIKENGLSKDET